MIPIEDVVEVVNRYLARFPEERHRLLPVLDEIDRGSAITDRAHGSGHLTCSAVLIDPWDRVLHIHHNTLDRWLRPGGHLEPQDTSLAQAALRELGEETGVATSLVSPVNEADPLDIDVHMIPANRFTGEPAHWHFDLCYAFAATESPTLSLQLEEVNAYRWIPASKIKPKILRRKVMPIVASGRRATGSAG
jgi:8-oxo-dGTP pyrophosphatase MutT (NUDIX family)